MVVYVFEDAMRHVPASEQGWRGCDCKRQRRWIPDEGCREIWTDGVTDLKSLTVMFSALKSFNLLAQRRSRLDVNGQPVFLPGQFAKVALESDM